MAQLDITQIWTIFEIVSPTGDLGLIGKCSRVCAHWRNETENPNFWKRLHEAKWSHVKQSRPQQRLGRPDRPNTTEKPEDNDWRKSFQMRYLLEMGVKALKTAFPEDNSSAKELGPDNYRRALDVFSEALFSVMGEKGFSSAHFGEYLHILRFLLVQAADTQADEVSEFSSLAQLFNYMFEKMKAMSIVVQAGVAVDFNMQLVKIIRWFTRNWKVANPMSIAEFEVIFADFANVAKNLTGVVNSRAREYIAEVIELLVEVLNDWPIEPKLGYEVDDWDASEPLIRQLYTTHKALNSLVDAVVKDNRKRVQNCKFITDLFVNICSRPNIKHSTKWALASTTTYLDNDSRNKFYASFMNEECPSNDMVPSLHYVCEFVHLKNLPSTALPNLVKMMTHATSLDLAKPGYIAFCALHLLCKSFKARWHEIEQSLQLFIDLLLRLLEPDMAELMVGAAFQTLGCIASRASEPVKQKVVQALMQASRFDDRLDFARRIALLMAGRNPNTSQEEISKLGAIFLETRANDWATVNAVKVAAKIIAKIDPPAPSAVSQKESLQKKYAKIDNYDLDPAFSRPIMDDEFQPDLSTFKRATLGDGSEHDSAPTVRRRGMMTDDSQNDADLDPIDLTQFRARKARQHGFGAESRLKANLILNHELVQGTVGYAQRNIMGESAVMRRRDLHVPRSVDYEFEPSLHTIKTTSLCALKSLVKYAQWSVLVGPKAPLSALIIEVATFAATSLSLEQAEVGFKILRIFSQRLVAQEHDMQAAELALNSAFCIELSSSACKDAIYRGMRSLCTKQIIMNTITAVPSVFSSAQNNALLALWLDAELTAHCFTVPEEWHNVNDIFTLWANNVPEDPSSDPYLADVLGVLHCHAEIKQQWRDVLVKRFGERIAEIERDRGLTQ